MENFEELSVSFLFLRLPQEILKNIISENSIADVDAIGKSSEREGYTEFQLKVKLKVDYAYFQMESLLLSSFGNKLINDNYKIFLEELVPGLEDSLSRIFTDIVNGILYDSTYDEIFPV